jgi:hypothetical protein
MNTFIDVIEFILIAFTGLIISTALINSAGLPDSIEWVLCLFSGMGWASIASRLTKIRDK